MNTEQLAELQKELGLTDGKVADALKVTRQTWRNWKLGKPMPEFAKLSLCVMAELRRVSPENELLPVPFRIEASGNSANE